MPDDAGMDAEPAGHQCRSRRQTWGVGTVVIVEPDPIRRDAVYVGRSVSMMPVTAQVVGSCRVTVKKQKPHFGFSFLG